MDIVDAKRIGARRVVRIACRHRDLIRRRLVGNDLDALLPARAALGIEVGDGLAVRARHANGDVDPALFRDHDRTLACAERYLIAVGLAARQSTFNGLAAFEKGWDIVDGSHSERQHGGHEDRGACAANNTCHPKLSRHTTSYRIR